MTRLDQGLLFRVGRELFAVDLGAVEEAVDLADVQAVEGTRPMLRGFLRHRGGLVPLYTPAQVLNVAHGGLGSAFIIRMPDDTRVAIAVDDVVDAVSLAGAEVRQPGGTGGDRVLQGVVRLGSELVGVVDLHALVEACRGVPEAESQ